MYSSIKFRVLILFTAVLLMPATLAFSQEALTDLKPFIPIVEPPAENTQQNVIQNGVEFFFNEGAFESECNRLNFENFENTNNTPPNDAISCGFFINDTTNNDCYLPGDIIPGFTMSAVFGNLVVATPNFNGVTNIAAGPNNFSDDMILTFSEFSNAVGLELVSGFAGFTADVEVFGQGDVLLASIPVDLTTVNGTFLGIVADQQITRIQVNDQFAEAELLYSLSFGGCRNLAARPIPTISEWGLIATAGVLGIVALIAIRRKKLSLN